MSEQTGTDRPWKVDETTKHPRGGVAPVVIGAVLFVVGCLNLATYGLVDSGAGLLIGLLGVGLITAGVLTREVTNVVLRLRR